MLRFFAVVLLGSIAAAVLLTGCDPDWPSHGRTAKVVGEVTLDGEPLVATKIVFLPKAAKTDGLLVRSSYATTDAQGKFKLKTSDDSEQVQFGIYTIILTKPIKDVAQARELGRTDFVPEKFNLRSTLTYELSTQEAFDRPVFNLQSD